MMPLFPFFLLLAWPVSAGYCTYSSCSEANQDLCPLCTSVSCSLSNGIVQRFTCLCDNTGCSGVAPGSPLEPVDSEQCFSTPTCDLAIQMYCSGCSSTSCTDGFGGVSFLSCCGTQVCYYDQCEVNLGEISPNPIKNRTPIYCGLAVAVALLLVAWLVVKLLQPETRSSSSTAKQAEGSLLSHVLSAAPGYRWFLCCGWRSPESVHTLESGLAALIADKCGVINPLSGKPFGAVGFYFENGSVVSLFRGDERILSRRSRRVCFAADLVTTLCLSILFGSVVSAETSRKCIQGSSMVSQSTSSGLPDVSQSFKLTVLIWVYSRLVQMISKAVVEAGHLHQAAQRLSQWAIGLTTLAAAVATITFRTSFPDAWKMAYYFGIWISSNLFGWLVTEPFILAFRFIVGRVAKIWTQSAQSALEQPAAGNDFQPSDLRGNLAMDHMGPAAINTRQWR
eukprot:TRINITY_DN8118_c0_g1_i1.p1 TRINITY_DN8118_c0_g1~~TRINITY_DN8118_c0_g1_i1.p1  ORF type:complete len:451 (+),score=77.74 TRINITY_DN8118_c0_g1_i1:18-1370(+)